MSPRPKPWSRLSPEARVEAVRTIEAEGHANSIIAFKLSAPRPDVDRICAMLRRERHAREDAARREQTAPAPHTLAVPTADRAYQGSMTRAQKGEALTSLPGLGAQARDIHRQSIQAVIHSESVGVCGPSSVLAGRASDESPATDTQGKPPRPDEQGGSAEARPIPADSGAGDPQPHSRESGSETMGGLPVAAASGTAEETGRTPAYAIMGRDGTPHRSGVTGGERPALSSPSDGDAIGAVKGSARLPDAAGVDPSPSDQTPAAIRQVTAPSAPTSSRAPMEMPERQTSSLAAPALVPVAPDPSIPWRAMSSRQKESAVLPLAAKGLSTAAIAKRLGLDSRNQVITVVQRLRKAGHLPPAIARSAARTTASKQPRVQPWKPAKASPRFSKPAESDRAALKAPASRPVVVEPRQPILVAVPLSRRLRLIDLDTSTCKWPEGDPRADDFSFCGNVTEAAPYCPYHRRIAFIPAAQRAARQAAKRTDEPWSR